MNSYADSGWFWLLVIGGLALVASAPTLIAILRRSDDLMTIVLFNVVGCVTVVGWPIALVLAFIWPRRQPRIRFVPYSPYDRTRIRPDNHWN